MAEPFLSEIRLFSFNFAPEGWAFCDGQLLPINQNQALFALLGTTYGGNGQTNFALPNLQGDVIVHQGGGFTLGQNGGEPSHTLITAEMPAHSHGLQTTTTAATVEASSGNFPASSTTSPYSTNTNTALGTGTTQVGGGQAHNNMAPYLVLNYCIALEGIFPTQN